jgi:anhydro-N-acetylmuramic acid kinase
MKKSAMRVVGLMSGTSADGVDAASVLISGAPPELSARLEAFLAVPYPAPVREAVLRIAGGGATTAGEISQLNFRLGMEFARAARELCRRAGIAMQSVDLIGSHGQTLHHQGRPAAFLGPKRVASTLQLGEAAVIAELTGAPVMSDFRTADVAAGGEGAPLVPFVDSLLLRKMARRDTKKPGQATLNIGGIANVTAVPAGAGPEEVLAFDTGPGNMVVDALARKFSRGRERFDRDALRARRGRLLRKALDEMLDHEFYRRPPPKTAGREQFGDAYTAKLLRASRKLRAGPEDAMHTATVLTAVSIAEAFQRFIFPRTEVGEVFVSGGGAHNPLMMAQIAALLPELRWRDAEELGVPGDAKEAFAFAILAYEAWHKRPNSLPAATGARHASILGKLTHAPER